jgi:hypothetical protein
MPALKVQAHAPRENGKSKAKLGVELAPKDQLVWLVTKLLAPQTTVWRWGLPLRRQLVGPVPKEPALHKMVWRWGPSQLANLEMEVQANIQETATASLGCHDRGMPAVPWAPVQQPVPQLAWWARAVPRPPWQPLPKLAPSFAPRVSALKHALRRAWGRFVPSARAACAASRHALIVCPLPSLDSWR